MGERTHKALILQKDGIFQLPGYFTLQGDEDLWTQVGSPLHIPTFQFQVLVEPLISLLSCVFSGLEQILTPSRLNFSPASTSHSPENHTPHLASSPTMTFSLSPPIFPWNLPETCSSALLRRKQGELDSFCVIQGSTNICEEPDSKYF